MARVDYEQMARRYDAGRDQPDGSREPWRSALSPWVDRQRPMLDLGAGTGQWSPLLADWFAVPVIAVEPSEAMQAAHTIGRSHPAVTQARGSAEAIPLADESVGTAWLSAVWHHVADPHRAAEELRRVVAPGGAVCLRGAFPDAGPCLDLAVLRAFPEARSVLDTFPAISEVTSAFVGAGFRHVTTEGVEERFATSRREAYERARNRADTLLRLLPDEVYERRLSQLRALADAEGEPDPPAPSTLTLVVYASG